MAFRHVNCRSDRRYNVQYNTLWYSINLDAVGTLAFLANGYETTPIRTKNGGKSWDELS